MNISVKMLGLVAALGPAITSCNRPTTPGTKTSGSERRMTAEESRCPPNTPRVDQELLRRPDGRLSDVRVLQFIETRLYVPTAWFGSLPAAPRPASENILAGMVEPEVMADECPGLVHQVTDEGVNIRRFIDVPLALRHAADQVRSRSPLRYFELWKMRDDRGRGERYTSSYLTDRFVTTKDHRGVDAFVRVRPDFGVRLDWRPVGVDLSLWQDRVQEWRDARAATGLPPPRSPREVSAWGSLLDTPDWKRMTDGVRAVVQWLETPPSKRAPAQTFEL